MIGLRLQFIEPTKQRLPGWVPVDGCGLLGAEGGFIKAGPTTGLCERPHVGSGASGVIPELCGLRVEWLAAWPMPARRAASLWAVAPR